MTDLTTTPRDLQLPSEPGATKKPRRRGAVHGLRRGLRALAPILTFAVILVIWEIVVRVGDVPVYQVPPISDVLQAMVSEASLLMPAAWVTVQEILLGFAASIVIGVPLALLIVTFKPLERTIYPLLVASQVVPKVAIAPLFIVWFGFGIFPKVLLVFLIAFFPVVIDSAVGLKSLETEKLYLARSMGANAFQTFTRLRLPNALPSIFAGVKLSATLAVIGAVVAEFVGADAGLGFVIQQANGNLDTVLLFAGIGYLTLIGVLMFAAVDLLERVMLPWHVSQRSVEVGTA
jgi:NitT/TauT family transport system permease protein